MTATLLRRSSGMGGSHTRPRPGVATAGEGCSTRAREGPSMPETTIAQPSRSASPSPFSMPLADAMRTQRAIRRLKPDPVDDALVLELIELALRAPTGSNAQNWEFVVVKDRAVKERLGQLNSRAWTLYGGLGRWMVRNDPKMLRILDAVQWQADHFAEIPVIVVACLRGFR